MVPSFSACLGDEGRLGSGRCAVCVMRYNVMLLGENVARLSALQDA